MRQVAVLIAALLFGSVVLAQDAGGGYCEQPSFRYTFPCVVRILSWVSVDFTGAESAVAAIAKNKPSYEKLVRLRFSNDASFLSQEIVDIASFYERQAGEHPLETQEKAQVRARFHAIIWMIGDNDYPIAWNVKCRLAGYAAYENRFNETIDAEYLGFGSKDALDDQVRKALRGCVESIAQDIFDKRLGGMAQ